MESKQIGTIIFTAAAVWGVYRFMQMPKEERNYLLDQLKAKTGELLDDADNTVEKVQQYVTQIQNTQSNDLFDKIFVIRKMFQELYSGLNNDRQGALTPSTSRH
jgi:phage-related protein